MGTITERKTKNGQTRYRAAIRINKNGNKHSESRTFSKRSLAENWLKKREATIELNPDIIHQAHTDDIRLSDLIDEYLAHIGADFGRSHRLSLLFIGKQPIGAKYVGKLGANDFSRFATERLKHVKPQTLNGDMIGIRSVLRYAKLILGLKVDLAAFEDVMTGLRYTRQIKPSDKRNRLPSADELEQLTSYFYKKISSPYPMHLIMWLAIYTARRESELTRLRLSDFDGQWWLVRDSKNPKGSKGNHKPVKIPQQALPIIKELQSDKMRKLMAGSQYYADDDRLIPLDAKTISKNFTLACKMLGIADLRFHDLRHEAATLLAENGYTIPQMQQITGHDSWSSLQRYTNLKPRVQVLEFADIMKKLKAKHNT